MYVNKQCYIGIDPAFRKSGFCVYIIDETNEHRYIVFRDFIEFTGWLVNDSPDNVICVVENSNMQELTFNMRGTKNQVAKVSRNVGKNQAVSQIAYELCQWKWGKNAVQVSPKEKGKKLTRSGYKAMFGLDIANQDARDAGKLAHMAKRIKKTYACSR